MDELGKLDILVNNAAYQNSQDSLEEVTEEQWDRTFRTNIYGYFYMAKAALPHLSRGGAIINTGSITGPRRQQGAARLLGDEGRDPRVHQVARSEPRRERDPRELRRARSGLDAAQSVRQQDA